MLVFLDTSLFYCWTVAGICQCYIRSGSETFFRLRATDTHCLSSLYTVWSSGYDGRYSKLSQQIDFHQSKNDDHLTRNFT
jgi:hypothetical protein